MVNTNTYESETVIIDLIDKNNKLLMISPDRVMFYRIIRKKKLMVHIDAHIYNTINESLKFIKIL